MSPKGLLNDPLVLFLVLGCLVFGAYSWLNDEPTSSNDMTIAINEDRLLQFLQYRTKTFDAVQSKSRLQSLSQPQLDELIAEYVEEEAMFRSATRLGLATDDYVIRRRLVQKMDFMAEGIGREELGPGNEALLEYFEANTNRYLVPATVTFTHVFYGIKQRTEEAALVLAEASLQQLNEDTVSFTDAPSFGERFVYHLNYVERPQEEVGAHFGEQIGDIVFSRSPSRSEWFGPSRSPHGYHLFLLVESQDAQQPKFEDVVDQVLADYLAERAYERRTRYAKEVVAQYQIELDSTLAR